MSNQHKRRQYRHPAGGKSAPIPTFKEVPVRARHDGWLPHRQIAFIRALAETACVEEACAAVGLSPRSAYTLRARADAAGFRHAWDAALDHGVHRLADAMLGRAINGVAIPIFFRGEQVGERRRYDERLAMFILRSRAPERYGKWRDTVPVERAHPDGAAQLLAGAIADLEADGHADIAGHPRPVRAAPRTERVVTQAEARPVASKGNFASADPYGIHRCGTATPAAPPAAASVDQVDRALRRALNIPDPDPDPADHVARTS